MFTPLDDTSMYITSSGSRRNAVISAILGHCNLGTRRDGYSRKVKCKRMFLLIVISVISVSFGLFSIWKITSKSGRLVDKQHCEITPYFKRLYNYPSHTSPNEKYSVFNTSNEGSLGDEFYNFRFLWRTEEKTGTANILPTNHNEENNKPFQRSLKLNELDSMFRAFDTFSTALRSVNVTFMMYGGSLIGAYRHHTMIPWDDDIDVLVNGSQKEPLVRALRSLTDYTLYQPPDTQWKFFLKDTTKVRGLPFSWPYIDIFFFGDNETHIWDEAKRYTHLFVFRKVDVFPLQFRPYQGSLQPVPCNSEHVLSRTYDSTLCTSSIYTHKTEMKLGPEHRKSTKCKTLYGSFPFVFREKHETFVIETVKIGDCVIYRIKTSLSC